MRIALFSECYLPVTNGVVTSLLTLRETLRAWGHTVYVFAPGAQQPDDDAEIFRLPELPFPRHPYHFARPFPRLSADFEALDVQVVHCQHPFTVGRLGADTARRYGLPMVYTAHSLYATMAAYAKSPILRTMGPKAARGVVRRFCDRAACVIAPSHATMDALIADGVHARFAVIPSGVLGPVIRPGAREEVRARLGIAPETPLLLCVGRLGPEKHLEMLLQAIGILRNRPLPAALADFRLALVGDGQCRADLESLTAELGIEDRVLFTGVQPHATIGDWYAAGDVFALSSPVETQGLVLVEAMAAGLPCVAVDDGGPRETLTHGATGLLVPFDPAVFADALEELMREPETRRRMGEKGRLRARDYSPEAMTRGVLEVYQAVSKAPRRDTSAPGRTRRLLEETRRYSKKLRTG